MTREEILSDQLDGISVYGADDKEIGRLASILADADAEQLIISVDGLLGLTSRLVAIDLEGVEFWRDDDGDVHALTSHTKDALSILPEFTADRP